MPTYRHTQTVPGLVWSFVTVASAVLLLLIVTGEAASPDAPAVVATLLIFAFAVLCLSSLSVEVTGSELRLWCGPGLFRLRIPLSSIVATGRAEVGPLSGYGIRLLPDGWLYRIQGTEVLVLHLNTGRRVLIGLDDLAGLERALRSLSPGSSL